MGEADGRRAMSGVSWEQMCAIYSDLDQEYTFWSPGWLNIETDFRDSAEGWLGTPVGVER